MALEMENQKINIKKIKSKEVRNQCDVKRENKIFGCYSNTQEVLGCALNSRISFQISKSFITIMDPRKPQASSVVT